MTTTENERLRGIDLLADTWGEGVPHDQFDILRREAPVFWHKETDGGPGFWAITKHADVKAASHDWRTFSSELGATFIPTADEEMLAQLQLTILNMDPPKHERYRRLVSRGFTPRMIRILVEDIERRAARVIDDVSERGEVEFVEEIAAQVPVQMICEMIGLEKHQWQRMFELSNQLVGGRNDPEYQSAEGPDAAAMEVYMLCDAVAADRRANPRDDIMTALVNAEVDEERLTDAELNLFFITLIVAGNETTRNLINHSMLALLDHPDQARRLREDPDLWDTAVEEMLRWGSSIHNFRRTATHDTELQGVAIKEGDKVVLYYASANRDEDVFNDPHSFDITRRPNDHLTFGGGGVHFCLGASLARLELKVMFSELMQRLPDITLATDDPLPYRASNFIVGPEAMPVRFTPA